MTKIDNKRVVELLNLAKTKLWNGIETPEHRAKKETMICFALCAVRKDYQKEYAYLKTLIGKRLGLQSTLESWLIHRGYIGHVRPDYQDIQAHRLAWIDVLIQEHSK